jgi:signal transduction histidine kinase
VTVKRAGPSARLASAFTRDFAHLQALSSKLPTITVEDDGPGLNETELAKGVKRGQRLDESKPGSGLGLSIVADLAHLYKGRFELEPSPEGGLRAKLELPAA